MLKPPFNNIEIGPFKAKYHSGIANETSFLSALHKYLCDHLLQDGVMSINKVEGKLSAVFDEDRYCGPYSVIKKQYELEIKLTRKKLFFLTETEDIKVEISYIPDTASFTTGFIKVLTGRIPTGFKRPSLPKSPLTEDTEKVCTVHGVDLIPEKVPIIYGLIKYPQEFLDASKKLFPRSGFIALGGCVVHDEKFHKVMYCEVCRNVHRSWCETHGVDYGLPR